MKSPSRNRKALALSLAMLVALPAVATAQGLFQRGIADEEYYGFGGTEKTTGMLGNRGEQTTGIINNQTFGQDVPLGSEIIVLLAAGVGYAVLKRKEEKQ